MTRHWGMVTLVAGTIALPVLLSCQSGPRPGDFRVLVQDTVPASLRVPPTIRRLAVLYPRPYKRSLIDAYARLEGAAFQLKEERPLLQIVDRRELPAILEEQRLQVGGVVGDEGAVRIGRLLGVDSVLLYQIDGPSLREQLFARYYEALPPVTVTSKIIVVESGEIVFHNVVTTSLTRSEGVPPLRVDDGFMDGHFRSAVELSVNRTISDLRRAFHDEGPEEAAGLAIVRPLP